MEEKQFMNEEFEHLCESLESIGAPNHPKIIMEAKPQFRGMSRMQDACMPLCFHNDCANIYEHVDARRIGVTMEMIR